MPQRLTVLFLSFVLPVLVSVCSSVTPARFQRGFIANGVCLELIEDENDERHQIGRAHV